MSDVQHDIVTDEQAPIGVAIVGSGIFAKEQHLPAVLATPALSLKAVYSRTLESASKLTSHIDSKIDWYTDETASSGRGYTELLSNPNIKAVIIALPILAQPQFIRQALEAGKHVLSEKPIAKDVNTARELLDYAAVVTKEKKCTWSIAENWRFVKSNNVAKEKISELGAILGFRVRIQSLVKGGKYFETAWRKTPEYQGGFLLDGGIHYVAAIRHMLGPEHPIVRGSAFSKQLQPHLPPVDTIDAILQTQNAVHGTFSVSFGTTFKGHGYAIACEKGTVSVFRGSVVVEKDGLEESIDCESDVWGVKPEIAAWAEGIASGDMDLRLSPQEALADLQLLEAMLRSGENGGASFDLSTR